VQIAHKFYKKVCIAMLLLLPAIAWSESKGPLYLAHPTNVAGRMLASGNYTLRWEGAGEQVQVKIYQGKNEVAAVPARVIQLSSPASFDSAVVKTEGGTTSLSEIRFVGKKSALHVGGNVGNGSASGAAK
jgi:hypothetical protein